MVVRRAATSSRYCFKASSRRTPLTLRWRSWPPRGSAAAPGFMDPEGVVVYVAAARTLFKKTIKGDAHKGPEDPQP